MKKKASLNIIFTLSIIVILFISIPFQTTFGSELSRKEDHIIYVDDDNIEGPWDGSIQHPYQTINDAIDASNDYSSIFIYSGFYEESLQLLNQADIFGEDKINTIISGSIEIYEKTNVQLSNLTITNDEHINENGTGIKITKSNHCVIKNLKVSNHHIGILLSNTSKMNIIKENTITKNFIGIDICSSSNNIIYGNIIEENNVSNLILYHSNGNHISQNIIQNAEHNLQFHTSKDTITQNYWGNQKAFQFFIGYHTLKGINFVIPWFKVLFHHLSDSSQQQINPIVLMKTSLGSMQLELFSNNQPITCQNFIDLAKIDFFNGLVFHRVIDDFVIQGGGFDVNGSGKDSPFGTIPLETHPDVTHVDGAISMARTNDPNSATSQFFICDGAQHGLDENYAAFGTILVGFETLRNIAEVETTTKHFLRDWPIEEVIIEEVQIN